MPQLLRCPNGHEWDSYQENASEVLYCPVCHVADATRMKAPDAAPSVEGNLDETLLPNTPAPSPLEAETLLPPTEPDDDAEATMAPQRKPTAGPAPARPTGDAQRATVPTPRPPFRAIPGLPTIPGYEILGELGRGGMGVVYKARQARLDRTVALKMILAGARADDVVRFRREALAVARARHPNIVQIHEVGEHEGKPFCALEFVAGGTLHEAIHRAPPAARETARVLEAVARAVHHAHACGIVHRDLKPANVLMAEDGTPKVSDFGLAKELNDDVGQTHTGAIMGTPSYMAPEQAQGRTSEVGPPADIYALGGILYDMLTGRPPFRGETAVDTLHQVVTEDPVLPSRLRPNCPRDLETICLKCLQKEAPKRYATAQALAEDLRRYLDGEPIQARRVGLPERAAKWTRRRPAAAALLVVAAVTSLALPAAAVWFAHHERQRAHQADLLRADADRQRGRAEENFQGARAAVEEMLTHVAEGTLARVPHMEAVRRELLEKALRFYEDFAAKDAGPDAVVRRDRALASVRAGDVRKLLGDREAAERAYRVGLALLLDLAADGDDAQGLHDQATARNNLGNLLGETGRADEAEAEYGRAVELRRRLLECRPGDAAERKELGSTLNNLGTLRHGQNRFVSAEEAYRDALALLDALTAEAPGAGDGVRLAARVRNNLGRLLQETGRRADAEAAFCRARDDLRPLTAGDADPEDRRELATSLHALGDLRRDNDSATSEKAYDEAIALRAALASDFPAVPAYVRELATTHHGRALLLQAAGRRDDADADSGRALALKEKLAADYPGVPASQRDLAGALNNRGIFLHARNRLAEAEACYRRARDVFGRLADAHANVPEYRHEQARAALNLTALLTATNRPAEAEEECRRALAWQTRLAADFPAVPEYAGEEARCRHTLGTLLEMRGRAAEAEGEYAAGVASLTRLVRDHPKTTDLRGQLAECHLGLALVLRGRGEPARADEACRAALSLYAALAEECPSVPAYRQQLARCHNERAILLAGADKIDEAEGEFRRAAALQAKLAADFPGEASYALEEARSHNNLGVLLAQANRLRPSEEAYRNAVALQAKLVARFPTNAEARAELIRGWHNLGKLHEALGANEECLKDLREVLRQCEGLASAFPAVESYRHDADAARGALASFLERRGREEEARRVRRQASRND